MLKQITMNEIKIKTKLLFDVARSIDKTEKLRKLVFKDITTTQLPNGDWEIKFNVYSVKQENAEIKTLRLDEEGNPVQDENGEYVYDTSYEDILDFWYSDKKVIQQDIYDQIYNMVQTYLPNNLTKSEEQKWITQMGFMLMLINEGYGRNRFQSLNDFE